MTSEQRSENLLQGLPSLRRMNRRDQRALDQRLRRLALEARDDGCIAVAASLLRATYELEKV